MRSRPSPRMNIGAFLPGAAWCGLVLWAGAGGKPKEPTRPAPGPFASVEAVPIGAMTAAPSFQVGSLPASPRASSEASEAPAPLPATTKLARGTGSPADGALVAGDAAYDADDFALADDKYREAAGLAPKDAAPLVGLARVAIA